MGALALLEVLDRDGQVRQALPVSAFPVSVGRALDNDLVLSDPHVAPHHFRIESGDDGLAIVVGETRNGVSVGRQRWKGGERIALAGDASVVPEFAIGRTRLRLRLPGHALEPELPLAVAPAQRRQRGWLAGVALLVLAGLLFSTYLDTDPDGLPRGVAGVLLAGFVGTVVWCGLWALLSKTFTRQGRFGWHLRVFLIASLALMVVDALPKLLAFMFSWPAVSNFAYVGSYAVGATALYFHLLAVEPARPRLMRWVALTIGVTGIAMTAWFNQQRNDRLGEDLYLMHLFPPALRVAQPVSVERFIEQAQALQPVLERKAKEPPFNDDTGGRDDE